MNEPITPSSRGRYTTSDYATNNLNVYIKTHIRDKDNKLQEVKIPQYYNQYLYFRVVDIYNNTSYYSTGNQYKNNDILGQYGSNDYYFTINELGAILYPYPLNKEDFTINNSGQLYKLIKPKESITLPLIFEYNLGENDNKIDKISKTISFDVRTSLYNDPTNYKVAIKANYEDQLEEKILRATSQMYNKYSAVVIDK